MFVLLLFSPQDKWFKQELFLLVGGCADSDWEVTLPAAALQLVNMGIVLINHNTELRKGPCKLSSPSSSLVYPKQIEMVSYHLLVQLSTMVIIPLVNAVLALEEV